MFGTTQRRSVTTTGRFRSGRVRNLVGQSTLQVQVHTDGGILSIARCPGSIWSKAFKPGRNSQLGIWIRMEWPDWDSVGRFLVENWERSKAAASARPYLERQVRVPDRYRAPGFTIGLHCVAEQAIPVC